MSIGPQQEALIEEFHPSLIKTKQGNSYVSHSEYQQKFVRVLGRMPDFRLLELIRDDVFVGKNKNGTFEIPNCVTGCIATMSAEIDGQRVTVTEAGDVEFPANTNTNGARAKLALSDAYKRCALRLVGMGLHMYAGDEWAPVAAEKTPYEKFQGLLDKDEELAASFKSWWAESIGTTWTPEAFESYELEIRNWYASHATE